MNDLIFFGLMIFFIGLILRKEAVTDFLFEKMELQIASKTILYIGIGGIVILMIFGILFDNTKEKYSDISSGYNQMRPNAPGVDQDKKPHRFFDIDFDSIFPW